MNSTELQALITLRDLYQTHLECRFDEIYDGVSDDAFEKSKAGLLHGLDNDLRSIAVVRSDEFLRSIGVNAFVESDEPKYLLAIDKASSETSEPRFIELTDESLMSTKPYRDPKNAVCVTDDVEELSEFIALSGRTDFVVIDIQLRQLLWRMPPVHNTIFPRLKPGFDYFSKFNHPSSALAAAKYFLAVEVMQSKKFVERITKAKFERVLPVMDGWMSECSKPKNAHYF